MPQSLNCVLLSWIRFLSLFCRLLLIFIILVIFRSRRSSHSRKTAVGQGWYFTRDILSYYFLVGKKVLNFFLLLNMSYFCEYHWNPFDLNWFLIFLYFQTALLKSEDVTWYDGRGAESSSSLPQTSPSQVKNTFGLLPWPTAVLIEWDNLLDLKITKILISIKDGKITPKT